MGHSSNLSTKFFNFHSRGRLPYSSDVLPHISLGLLGFAHQSNKTCGQSGKRWWIFWGSGLLWKRNLCFCAVCKHTSPSLVSHAVMWQMGAVRHQLCPPMFETNRELLNPNQALTLGTEPTEIMCMIQKGDQCFLLSCNYPFFMYFMIFVTVAQSNHSNLYL